jgi:argininosuccinate lyase
LEASLSIFSALIGQVKVSGKIEENAAAGFIAATEVANMLVRKYGVAFRTSHKIVGALVKALIGDKKTLKDATAVLLQKVAMEVAGLTLIVKDQDIVSCTDLRNLIETYKVQGGPSPTEVKRVLKIRNKLLEYNNKVIAALKDDLTSAETMLNKVVEAYSSLKSVESVKLKN